MFFRKLFLLAILLTPIRLLGQLPAPEITVGPEKLTMADKLMISVTVFGTEYTVDNFPVLEGFEKESTITSHNEVKTEGKNIQTHTISRTYRPLRPGVIKLPEFDLLINGEEVTVKPKTIDIVGDEFQEINQNVKDADFVLGVSKKSVFVGEGFKVRLSFYISEKNTRNYQFPSDWDLSQQIELLSKKIKPQNSLENRKVISSVNQRETFIKGVRFYVYDIFEAVYYPLNNDLINIPSLSLKMQADEGKEVFMKSNSATVSVKPLPENPLKDKVPVGSLRLIEKSDGKTKKSTGESFSYKLVLQGEANMNSVNLDKIEKNKNFDFFDTGISNNQKPGELVGEKIFNFKVLPKIAGNYNLGEYFHLVYFNINTSQYDTLKALGNIEIVGDSIITQDAAPTDIYSGIEQLKTDYNVLDFRRILTFMASLIWVFMFIFVFYIWRKK